MKKHYKSVFDNEQDLLKAIIDIHIPIGKIQLDPMYFKGNFYKDGVLPPDFAYDRNVELCGDNGIKEDGKPTWGDATNLNFLPDNYFESIILDPPFLFGVHGKQKIIIAQKHIQFIKILMSYI